MQDKADMTEEQRVRLRFEYNIQAWRAKLLWSGNEDEAKQHILPEARRELMSCHNGLGNWFHQTVVSSWDNSQSDNTGCYQWASVAVSEK